MSDTTHKLKRNASLFELDGIPKFSQSLPLALQHVVAMIVGCVTPVIIVTSSAGVSAKTQVIMIQAALIFSAVSTLLQLFPIRLFGRKIQLGSGLPVILGVSFAYVPTMVSIATDYDIGTILGAQIVGGCVAIVAGLFMSKLRRFFPPLVTGTVVFTIGLSLYPTAVNYMAGGSDSPDFGSWQNWLVAVITLTIVTLLNHFGKGVWKLASILIGMAAGYVISFFFGMVDFTSIGQASYVQLPHLMPIKPTFEFSACFAFATLFAINSIQAVGDFSAVTSGALDRDPETKELQGGIVGFGITNIISALFGCLPSNPYGQNVGIVTTTKVVNRCVLGLSALILLIAGIIPKFSAILTTVPYCVLGGATVGVFASIAMTGMKLVASDGMSPRSTSIVGLAAALGVGVSEVNGALAAFPAWVTTVFGKSPVVIATIVAVLLNMIIPKDKKLEETDRN
ncbi:uracil-xanthine permease family protein [Novisyntrophococcus fermenticellae]|uniref:uracil-xanthine permease family protein n=1 Tax=Novisyntrophococcus fermenticellae TaxID=2068655 RepID=UPI001E2F0673|nr:nucleobase:cation symporter-2 family protein [Novisyntrophococcus fermenticellae]